MNLREFNVSWFATILGSGGVAIAFLSIYPALSWILTVALTAIFALLTCIWFAKLIFHWDVAKKEIQHVVIGNFYPLQPISAVILAILYKKFMIPFDEPLLIYGSVLILIMTIYLSYHFFANVTAELKSIHGGWFIPPVSTILVTDAILLYPPDPTKFAISLIYFGIGFMLFLFIATILFLRLVNHELMPFELAPTNFIILAPIGILIVDILSIFNYAGKLFTISENYLALIFSIPLWGFGFWALVVNLILLLRYIRQEFPFFLGWWSYVFPTAAFTLATIALSRAIEVFRYITYPIFALLIVIWVLVSINTIKMLIQK